MRSRRFAALAMLAVITVASFAVWQIQPKSALSRADNTRSDYVLENFEMTSLNELGQEAFTVTAPHLERDPQGKSLTLQLPKFTFPDRKGGRWQASSASAWVAEKGVEVRLIDNVLMLGPVTTRGGRTRFETAHLQIFPKQQKARSDDRVTIRQADSILHGVGLRADMDSHKIQLLADVKGRYAPRRHK